MRSRDRTEQSPDIPSSNFQNSKAEFRRKGNLSKKELIKAIPSQLNSSRGRE
jgi:hypothetical protein